MNETHKCAVLDIEVHVLEYFFLGGLVVLLSKCFVSVPLIAVEIGYSFIKLDAFASYNERSSCPKFLIFILFLVGFGVEIET
jgi:hypothetical protein